MKYLQIFLVIFLLSLCQHQSKGDTKILRVINISSDNAERSETFSLRNENTSEEELIINGNVQQEYFASSPGYVYRLETIYVADKDGYRVKYQLIREPRPALSPVALSPNTLKTLSG